MTDVTEVTLNPTVLRRLARLHARAEGAQVVAGTAMQSSQQATALFQEALTEECRDAGMSVPVGQGQVDVDWRTGVVSLQPVQSQALGNPPPVGNGLPGPMAAVEEPAF